MRSRTTPSASSSQTLVPPPSPKPPTSTGTPPPPAPPSILNLSSLTALLAQLTSPEGAPHSALLVHPSGAIIAASSVPTVEPWPTASLSGADEGERVRTYAAVGSSSWEDRGASGEGEGEVVLETWVSWAGSGGKREVAMVEGSG